MNKLSHAERARVLQLLCEGMSIRAITRTLNVGKNTVARLLVTAGAACMDYQDRTLVNLDCRRVEVDELWSFTHCKQSTVSRAKKAPPSAGDTWTWVAICAHSKLIPAWFVGSRDTEAAMFFMDNLAKRLANRVQLTSDNYRPYFEAVEGAFGGDVDYATLQKIYSETVEGKRRYSPPKCIGTRKNLKEGNPDKRFVSTSYVERNNGTIRQHCKRYARLTLAFSKKIENHICAFALHVMYHNFVRIHSAHKMSPAMAAGVTGKLWEMSDLVDMIEAWEAAQPRLAA